MELIDDIMPDPAIEDILSSRRDAAPRYIVGVDLGQSSDPTAICALEYRDGDRRIDCRHLERLPLGMSYPAVVGYVRELLSRPPLCGEYSLSGKERAPPATLVIDDSGVGRPVGDLFEEAGLKPIRVTITSGMEVTQPLRDHWHVSKTVLISTVDAMLHTGELRFAAALVEASAMKDELLDFRRHLSAAGRATYQARAGRHDDLVLAVAIGCWWLRLPPLMPRVVLGGY
jgi:hypothetical protein